MEEMLRVDHAGEYGANRIYEGQLLILGKTAMAPTLKHMLEQEQEHLKKFDQLLNDNKVRPSLLMPLWHVAGLALGVGSALLGKKAAMACTVAVEEAIEEHYNSQINLIKDAELKTTITKFRDEEVEHKDIAINNQAMEMKGYALFSRAIKLGAKASIFLAKKICIIAIIAMPFTASAARLDEGISALRHGNVTAAYNIIEPLALQGSPDAQYALCGMFYNAQGVPKNDYEAARWCHAAAQQGNTDAMFNLALMYQNGEGVGQNFIEAKKWYHEAAERGHKDAEFNLSELDGTNNRIAQQIENPGGVPTSAPGQTPPHGQPEPQLAAAMPPALPMPQQIAAMPQPQLQTQLQPQMMAAGTAAPRPILQQQPLRPQPSPQAVQMANIVPAPKPASVAQLQAVEPASGNMPAGIKTVPDITPDVIIVDDNSNVDPYSACIIAAQRGEIYDICNKHPANAVPVATKQTAQIVQPSSSLKQHSFNFDSEGNFSTAMEQAKKGDAEAQNNLGNMYRTGSGVAKNYGEAIKWLEKSASRGHVGAMLSLAQMYREGTGVAQNMALAYSWYNLAADRSHNHEDKIAAMTNVAEISKTLSNQQIGDALQYVTKLDERIPQYN